jgi:hypothetical protein
MAEDETFETPSVSLGPEQPAQKLVDLNSPVAPLDIRLNFNCVLYILTDLVALLNKQMEVLHAKGHLSTEDLEGIYAVTTDKEKLGRVYGTVFNRFMDYYVANRKAVLEEQAVANMEKAPSDTSVEGNVPEADSAEK